VLLNSCTLPVESVVLGTSEGGLGRGMALWQTGGGSSGETLGRAHEGTLGKHCGVCWQNGRGGVEIRSCLEACEDLMMLPVV
jgi:hypothetical protein